MPKPIDELLHVGELMSNLCFNLSQPSWLLDDRARAQMKQLQKEWDKARQDYHVSKQARKRKGATPCPTT